MGGGSAESEEYAGEALWTRPTDGARGVLADVGVAGDGVGEEEMTGKRGRWRWCGSGR